MRLSPLRGLALSAVGALAVTGLAVTATPAAHADGPAVVLLSQAGPAPAASVRYDGSDFAISLSAARLDPGATITFEVNTNPDATDAATGWSPIDGSVAEDGDLVVLTWDGNNNRDASLLGRRVALRAVATTDDGAGGTDVSYSRRNRVQLEEPSSEVDTVALEQGQSSEFFAQPYADSLRTRTYARVRGTASATEGTVALSWRGADGSFRGTTDAQVLPQPGKTPAGDFSSSTYTGVLDVTGHQAASGTPLTVRVARGTDEVRDVVLQAQSIDRVDATAGPVRQGQEAPVTIQVRDNLGNPITGAEVRRSSDGEVVGYTDDLGQVTTRQFLPTDRYYANATDGDGYDAGVGDVESSDVTPTPYIPSASSSRVLFADGAVFDDDEYEPGDIAVQVLDQEGQPLEGAAVTYRVTPEGEAESPTLQGGVTGDGGVLPVAFDPATAPDGDVVVEWRIGKETDPSSGDPLDRTTFTAGQAVLELVPDPEAGAAPIGGTIDYLGSLTVTDRPLAGRGIALGYTRGVEVVPGNRADAGIVTDTGVALASSAVTNERGLFRVRVADRQEDVAASEIDGRLVATTTDNVPSDDSTLAGNAGQRAAATTRFGDGTPGSVRVRLSGTGNGAAADVLRVDAPGSVAGEKVTLFRLVSGRLVAERTVPLDAEGDVPRLSVRDRNRAATTTYVVKLLPSKRVKGATSNQSRLS